MLLEKEAQQTLLNDFATARVEAHALIFAKRHPEESPPFHAVVIETLNGPSRRILLMAFRGGGKSTLGEEATILKALYEEFKNGIIIGSSYERAVERLRTIKHELENNELIGALFGSQVGGTWTENRIVLSNGVMLQAYGRGQSLRGAKHLDKRPDYCLVDDFEEEDSVRTEDAKQRTMSWFVKVLVPALDPKAQMIVLGTPLDYDAVLVKLSKNPMWHTMKFPIMHYNENGEEVSSWPDRFPLQDIYKLKEDYERMGSLTEFVQEYMCKAEEEGAKAFDATMFKTVPRGRSWEPVYIFVDPARTTGVKSAHTGVAVWSWIANRLHVWRAFGGFLKPDEIVELLFTLNNEYNPVEIGVEEDGLNEFLMQPIRQEMTKRGIILPVKGVKAPKGKLDFIKSLQPFFRAGEVTMQDECEDLRTQLLNFPTGKIDVPNALAYANKIGKGIPVYEGFSDANVVNNIVHRPGKTFLVMAYDALTCLGAVISYQNQVMHVIEDYVAEGDVITAAENVLQQANLGIAPPTQIVLHPEHFDTYRGSGLPQKLKRYNLPILRGNADVIAGRDRIRELIDERKKDGRAFRVSPDASWTLRGLAGGYNFAFDKKGLGISEPQKNHYKTLFEGIETFAGNLLKASRALNPDAEDANIQYDYTNNGRRFISALPR